MRSHNLEKNSSSRKTVGLIVNPVAGMGGSVGLKGTDGDTLARALEMGAEPVSPDRAIEFLTLFKCHDTVRWLTGPGEMGADWARRVGLSYEKIGQILNRTTAKDTKAIAREMLEAGADIIVFAGGDGTARDIADAVGLEIPVIALPAGVKVYSAVFAYSPRAAASLLEAFMEGTDVEEEEVLDIDEDAFRAGRVDSHHYGFLLVPRVETLLQGGKESSGVSGSAAEAKQSIAEAVIESMSDDRLYLLGTGTTVRFIADALHIPKTLLGVDAVVNSELVGTDLNEKSILILLDRYPKASIVLTPLGGNGFIFGRGNKQFTPTVIRRIGPENIIVVANRDKLLKLSSLHVDTGDADLDRTLYGYIEVVVGHGHSKLMRIE